MLLFECNSNFVLKSKVYFVKRKLSKVFIIKGISVLEFRDAKTQSIRWILNWFVSFRVYSIEKGKMSWDEITKNCTSRINLNIWTP